MVIIGSQFRRLYSRKGKYNGFSPSSAVRDILSYASTRGNLTECFLFIDYGTPDEYFKCSELVWNSKVVKELANARSN